ncbi:MAG TPA: flavin reductase family protein, partial [Trebonia sp.]|nr:flavin reductase family protein [Trebonia sp.]
EPALLRDRLPAGAHAPADLRRCLGMFATGITVVTAGGREPCGMTANSFTSVSLDPALVLVCIAHDAVMHAAILSGETFAISVLAAHQEPVARHFANRARPRGGREFEAVSWRPGPVTGAPVVADALAWIECALAAVYDGGDHSIFVGSVLDMGRGSGGDALLYYGGGYHRLEPGARG